jgi:hypothetical protein
MRLRLSTIIRLARAAMMIGAPSLAGAQGSPTLYGDVASLETGGPLGHSMVTVVGLERQTFTSDGGVFAFASLEPGRYRIRAVHIGFTPADVSVEVVAGATPPRVHIALARLSVQLATVKVTATAVCRTPGRPNPDVEPDFAAIVGQLRLNAEQFKLLSDSFPFTYKVQQIYYTLHSDSSRSNSDTESETYRSNARGWEYKMGDLIGIERDGNTVMHLPTLRDFASYEFLNNHCFSYGGIEQTRNGALIRIAFQADVQIKTPDVSGTVFLDAKTYQIRRADLRLTKIPSSMPNATAVNVTTIFGEVSPAIDIIQEVHGLTSTKHHAFSSVVGNGEDQRMYALEWLVRDPARPAVQP